MTQTDGRDNLAAKAAEASIDLYWLPLGAGGWFVRLNGRIYEAIRARLERRRPLDLYHTALEVRVPEGRFVIENSWPIPDDDGASRGVVVEGPVGNRWIAARFRVLRYEVRRWRDGIIPDADAAVASPQRLSDDPRQARRLLDLVGSVPRMVWGRDEIGTGDMWNSNSVIAWLVARSGIPTDMISPPAGGRAPGWDTGLVTARLQQPSDERVHSIIGPRKSARITSTIPILPDALDLTLRSGSRRNWRTQPSLRAIDGQARVLDDAETERSRHERVTEPSHEADRGGQITKARRTSFA